MKELENKLTEFHNFFIVLFFLNVYLLFFEKTAINNTIYGLELFIKSACVGAITAIFFLLILNLFKPNLYKENKRKFILNFQLFSSIVIFIASMSSFINRKLANEIEIFEIYSIIKMDYNHGSGRSKSTFSIKLKLENNHIESFEIESDLYFKLMAKGKVRLCTRKGFFGYDYITEFKTL